LRLTYPGVAAREGVIALLVITVIAVGLAWRYGAANLSWRYRGPARPPNWALDGTPAAPRISILSARTVQVSVVIARFGRIEEWHKLKHNI
jgi:hypothetical protein